MQDRSWSGAIFGKITGSGHIGHLGYQVRRARVITAATFSMVAASNPAVAGRGFEALVPRTARGRLKLGGSCVPSPGWAPSERMRHFVRLALDGDL